MFWFNLDIQRYLNHFAFANSNSNKVYCINVLYAEDFFPQLSENSEATIKRTPWVASQVSMIYDAILAGWQIWLTLQWMCGILAHLKLL